MLHRTCAHFRPAEGSPLPRGQMAFARRALPAPSGAIAGERLMLHRIFAHLRPSERSPLPHGQMAFACRALPAARPAPSRGNA